MTVPTTSKEEKVPTATLGSQVGGTAMVVSGTGLLAVGALGAMLGVVVASETCTPAGSSSCDHFYGGPGMGGLIIGVSAVVLISGGLLLGFGAKMLDRPRAHTTTKAAFVREPTWVGPQAASTAKAPLVLPLAFSF